MTVVLKTDYEHWTVNFVLEMVAILFENKYIYFHADEWFYWLLAWER